MFAKGWVDVCERVGRIFERVGRTFWEVGWPWSKVGCVLRKVGWLFPLGYRTLPFPSDNIFQSLFIMGPFVTVR